MRFALSGALSCALSFAASAATLPTTATLGAGELPVRDSSVFLFGSGGITVVRAADDAAVDIPVSKATDEFGFTSLTFQVPDGQMIVITGVELPVKTTPITMWIAQLAGSSDSELGWVIYDDFGIDDGSKNPNTKDTLATPLVLAPGKTYQLHTSDIASGVTARGYFLDETQ